MSKALEELLANLEDVDDLLAMHTQLTGGKRGRPKGALNVEAISRSCVVLVVAFWENYVESVVAEAANFLETNCPSFVSKPWFKTSFRNFNTPNAGNVERLMGSVLGFTDPIRSMTWQKMGKPHERLKGLMDRRHDVAHKGRAATRQWKSAVTRDRQFVQSLATRLDREIGAHVRRLCRKKPW